MRREILILGVLLPMWVVAQSSQVLDKVVAVVNDNVITASELDSQVDVLRQQLASKKVDAPADDVLRKQVLHHLIDVDIQLQLARRNEMAIDAPELNNALEKIASNNHLTLTQLHEAIEKNGLKWDSYRDNIQKEMLINRIQQQAVGKDVVITAQQVDDYLKTAHFAEKEKQVFHLQNIVIPLPEEPTSEQVTRAKQKADNLLSKLKQGADFSLLAISESSGEYALEGGDLGERQLPQLPEIFAQKVVQMKTGEVAGPLRTENGFQLIKLVSAKGTDEHHEVTKTHVRHILIKANVNVTAEEASKQVNNIYQQLKSGKDFGVMAKQYSVDAASAIKEGDLGWVTGDELVPQFAEAMEQLPLHQVSKPVKSPFGWHLIEVIERKKIDDSNAFKRQQVRQFLQERKFGEAVQNWQQHLRADAYVKVLDKALA